MTKKILLIIACMVFGSMIEARSAWGGSVSLGVYVEAYGPLGMCTDSGSTSAGCDTGLGSAYASIYYLPPYRAWLIALGAADGGLASGSISDPLTFGDSSLVGSAFVEFTFGIQLSNYCPYYSNADATAGNQTVPLSSLNYDIFGVATFRTTAQPITFGSPFDFGMSGDVLCAKAGEIQFNMVLDDVLVLNANGDPILGVSLTSGSGTIYPLDSQNITPEPASLLLLGTGALGFLAAVRFRIV